MTRTSVVVPSYGGARRLPVLLGALARQTDRDAEVVVVLDGDVDGSAEVVAALAASHPLDVRAVVLPENQGRSAALNAGFAAATGEVLVRCDDDLEPGPEYVERHVAAHAGPDPVGVIGVYRNRYPASRGTRARTRAYARAYGRPADVRLRAAAYAAGPADTWRYWAGNVSVTRATYDRVGPYDERFRAYGWEDVDWGYRLHVLGVPVLVRPELVTDHHVAAQTATGRAARAYLSGAARARFEAKHGPASVSGVADPGAAGGRWDRLVHAVAGRLDEDRTARAGGLVDTALPVLPTPVGAKAVALLVEASHRAGRDQAPDDRFASNVGYDRLTP